MMNYKIIIKYFYKTNHTIKIMVSEEIKEAKKIANELKPQFNIGKNKVTDTLIESIDQYLDAHQIVKIKVLSAISKDEVKEIAEQIANATDSEIVQKVGFTFVLFRN